MWSEEWKKETNWFVIKLLLLKLKGLSISNISMLLTLLSSRWPCVRTDWRRKWVGRNQHRTLVQCPCKALQRVQLQGTLDIFVPLNSSPGPNRGDLYVKIKNRRMFSSEVKSFDCWLLNHFERKSMSWISSISIWICRVIRDQRRRDDENMKNVKGNVEVFPKSDRGRINLPWTWPQLR